MNAMPSCMTAHTVTTSSTMEIMMTNLRFLRTQATARPYRTTILSAVRVMTLSVTFLSSSFRSFLRR